MKEKLMKYVSEFSLHYVKFLKQINMITEEIGDDKKRCMEISNKFHENQELIEVMKKHKQIIYEEIELYEKTSEMSGGDYSCNMGYMLIELKASVSHIAWKTGVIGFKANLESLSTCLGIIIMYWVKIEIYDKKQHEYRQ